MKIKNGDDMSKETKHKETCFTKTEKKNPKFVTFLTFPLFLIITARNDKTFMDFRIFYFPLQLP